MHSLMSVALGVLDLYLRCLHSVAQNHNWADLWVWKAEDSFYSKANIHYYTGDDEVVKTSKHWINVERNPTHFSEINSSTLWEKYLFDFLQLDEVIDAP